MQHRSPSRRRLPLHSLPANRSGAAALEFALVSLPFLGFLLGLMSIALNLYLQFALDYSLQQAVRQVQIGNVPAGTSVGTFTGSTFCPIFTLFASCSGVSISVQPVTDYYSSTVVSSSNKPTSFCVGQPGQLMYARAVYPAPVISTIFPLNATPTNAGSYGTTIISAAAFANENPTGAPTNPTPGC